MGKKLSEMTLQELWQLFPIYLTGHQTVWKDWYEEEKRDLEHVLLPDQLCQISHIGSTAVPAIWAKPIIDILVEMPADGDMNDVRDILIRAGWICMRQEERRMSFNKGYTEEGFARKVYHLHLRYEGDNDEIYFRDYLLDHPDTAKEYEEMKLKLWKEFEHDRDGYTDGKTEFVRQVTRQAKED